MSEFILLISGFFEAIAAGLMWTMVIFTSISVVVGIIAIICLFKKTKELTEQLNDWYWEDED